jgi:hypothetical protein
MPWHPTIFPYFPGFKHLDITWYKCKCIIYIHNIIYFFNYIYEIIVDCMNMKSPMLMFLNSPLRKFLWHHFRWWNQTSWGFDEYRPVGLEAGRDFTICYFSPFFTCIWVVLWRISW